MSKTNKLDVFNPNNRQFFNDNIINDLTYEFYFNHIKQLCLSIFDWDLPFGMDERFLEEVLFYNGQASLLKTKEYGYINTACCNSGNLNIYGKPTKLNCYSFGFNEYRNLYINGSKGNPDKECILVYNNQTKLSTSYFIDLFAYRLYKCDRVCDINLNGLKTPIVILTDDNTKLSMINAYTQYDGNKPVIIGKKGSFDINDISSINTKVDFICDKILEYKIQIWNELLTFLGINNLNEKKERLITDETSQNNEVINYNLQSFYVPRKKACEEFNNLFNEDTSVKLRSDLKNTIKETESIIINKNKDKIIETSKKIVEEK